MRLKIMAQLNVLRTKSKNNYDDMNLFFEITNK